MLSLYAFVIMHTQQNIKTLTFMYNLMETKLKFSSNKSLLMLPIYRVVVKKNFADVSNCSSQSVQPIEIRF